MDKLQSFLLVCGLCCVWPGVAFMLGWGFGRGRLALPGRAGRSKGVKMTAAQKTLLKGISPARVTESEE